MVASISKPQDIGWDFYTTRVDDRGSVSLADVCLTPLRWAVAGKAYNVAVVKGTVSLPTGKVSINRLHKENRFELSHRILGVALTLLFSPLVTLGLGIKLLLRDRASVERYQWVKIAEGERWAVMQQQMLTKKPKEISLTPSQKAKMEHLSEGLEEKYPKKVLLFADRFYSMAKSIERKLGNALPQDDQFQTKRDRLIAWMVTTLGEREGDLTALPKIYVRLSKLAPQRQKKSLEELLTEVDKGHDLSHFLDKLPTVPNEERICEEMGALETLQQKPENLALLKFIDRYPATDLPKRKEYRARLITWLFAEVPYKERYTYVGGLVADQAVAQLTRDLRHVLVLLEEQGDKASADQTEAFLTELADKSLVCAPTWLELAARHIRVLTNTDKMEDRLQQYLLEIKEDLIQGYLDETTKKLQAQRYQLHTDWNWLNVMRSKLGDEL
ncbi:MAG: hypothetical protein KDK65_06545, partial [Chlamydiia bacterium]|nr:hypothetical protein [Chlamydiia bacterium]